MTRTLPLVIFAVIGVAALVVCGLFYWRDQSFRTRSLPTDGIVASCEEHRPEVDRDNVTWKCALDWKDRDGGSHRFIAYGGATKSPPGSVVPLRYDPEQLDDVRRDVGPGMAMFIFGAIGVAFVGIAARVALSSRAT